MGFITKYGTQWGAIPMTAGNVHWVAPSATYTVEGRSYGASDGNDGLSPERALLTIQQAVTNATANAGDIIVALPGTHTVATTSVAWNKAGLTLMGLPYFPQGRVSRASAIFSQPKTIITTSITTDEAINITAADSTFVNFVARPITGAAFANFTTAASRLKVLDVHIDLKTPVGAANTAGFVATGATQAPTYVSFVNCTAEEDNAGTSQSYAINLGAAAPFLVDSCTIWKDGNTGSSAAWAVAIKVNDNAWGFFRDVDFLQCTQTAAIAGGSITKGIEGVDMTVLESITALRCFAHTSVTKAFDDFGAGDVALGNNYVTTVAGGTGGTLITATT